MKALLASLLFAVVPVAGSLAQAPAPEISHALAPAGRLRVAINLGNVVLAQRNQQSGALGGVSVEIAREIGRRLSLPVDLIPFDGAGKVTDALAQNAWDMAFLAIDPVRARQIDFSPPYVLIEGTYVVAQASTLRTIADVDQPGVRIAAGRGSAYDLYLTRALKSATIVRAPSSAAAIELFRADGLDAAAGVKQPLAAYAAANPAVRLIDGRFMSIEQAIALPAGRVPATRYVAGLIEELKASGFVARALAASGQGEAQVAPAQPVGR